MYRLLISALFSTSVCIAQSTSPTTTSLPATPKRPVTDTYFGKAVVDNYRWLEDMDKQEVKDWFKAQGDYTAQTLDQIPGRDTLVSMLVRYDALKSARLSNITRRNGRYFYKKRCQPKTSASCTIDRGRRAAKFFCLTQRLTPKTKSTRYRISYQAKTDISWH
ncbi:hypothetical protein [Spirosoma utsteinense]|uniref:Protease II n=1 Tax=Spirosoma utsteinense TaxID=2585773 RepID=A0ABR6W3M3_9BACT|nr:hypothetical protein [Spirosoma utsteinense]MBC3786008.1 protease II [Spirosoma utsteinense]MBC3790706.1 protease II [Spirosoma utsteinense]